MFWKNKNQYLAFFKSTSLVHRIIPFLFFVLIPGWGSAQNIVDYYRSLPESFFAVKDLGDTKYPLFQKEKQWFSKSLAGYEFSPVVDTKNGYIEFNDEGTGGGNNRIQVVLFRKADRSPLIGITKGGFNGFYYESTSSFYVYTNNTWKPELSAFPEIKIDRFLNKYYRNLAFVDDQVVVPNLSTLTTLPRLGTLVNLELNFNKYDFLIEANHNPHLQKPFSKKEEEKLWKIIENIAIESFQLQLNKNTGKFEVVDSVLFNAGNANESSGTPDSAELISDEEYILDQLWELEAVNDLAMYIDSASNHQRDLKLLFEGTAEDEPDYYRVRGAEDNGGNYVTHFIFHIHKNSFEIYLYDVVDDAFKKIDQ